MALAKPGHMLLIFYILSYHRALLLQLTLFPYSQGARFQGEGEQHRSFLYIQIHSTPGPLSHSLCAPVWLLPVSGKDGKLQEGSERACSVLCGPWWSSCSSLKQTIAADAQAGVRLCIWKSSPTRNTNGSSGLACS